MKSETFSPKSFLSSRRPEQFSDTVYPEVTELDRSLLEYHLDSLTSRSQETDFERFARRLCEYEICPNLLPQTGPTGGGDSKVDSETYPVADDLALIWYYGIGREASDERWAFAFSAKATWRPKVQSDIKKIAETSREYKKAFFVTNQYVPDRKRAEVEDALREKYCIDVRILDRTWILDRIFIGKHEAIAIEELGITALTRRKTVKGPQDIKREEELDELEKRIQDAIQTGRTGPSLVDDVIEAAKLARNLERSRPEIEGRFQRVKQISQKYGSSRQRIEANYQWAWTLYWWFEEYDSFAKQYVLVEELTRGSRNAYDLEQLTNLWYCLLTAISREKLDCQQSNYQAHTENLLVELERLQNEEDRPSTALQAETLYIQVQMLRRIINGESPDDLLEALRDVVLKSEGLVGYPLEPLVDILAEIGFIFEEFPVYDTLFETIVDVTASRDGDIRAARMLLNRGKQQIDQSKYVEAIATLGRALRLLYKNETRHAVVQALYLCGHAYEEMGLLWAAHGTLLSAASIATNEFWQYENITLDQARCYRRLKWIELFLGRLPYIFSWHELDIAIRYNLVEQGYNAEALLPLEPETIFEGLLGCLLLRTKFSELKHLVALPDVLDRLGLELASDGLLYMLGHTERLEATCQNLGDTPSRFVSHWRDVKLDRTFPNYPELYNQQQVSLGSRVLGCKITVNSQTQSPCVEVAESLLAAIESLLATSTLRHAVACEPELTMNISISDSVKSLIEFSLGELTGRPHIAVYCRSFNPHKMGQEEQGQIKEVLLELTTTIMAQIILFKDLDQDLKVLFKDERAFERSLDFTGTFVTQSNVLGDSPKTHLSTWVEESVQTYPLLRTKPWEPIGVKNDNREDAETASPEITSQEPPPEMQDPNFFKHNEIETISPIRNRLWDRAGWSGVFFGVDLTNEYPPIFALIFKNREAGREIFTHWRNEFGEIDKQEQLRLVIVRGIDLAHPHAYRVIIGFNPALWPASNKMVLFMNRIHRMDANTSDNLDRFLESRAAVDAFFLAPAFVSPEFDGTQTPEFEMELRILIHSVIVRDAWEIGVRDIDSMGIQKGDTPIIPEGVENAPVYDLLKTLEAS
jgi:hypothetical protein